MSLLGVDYGSDSEEDRPFAPPAPRPDPPVSPATTLSVSGTTAGNAPGSDSISTADSGQGEKHRRKKRKVKVAVSILPSHIQAALMRAAPLRRSTGQKEGPVTGVSDDEDDENDYADEMERKELDEEVGRRGERDAIALLLVCHVRPFAYLTNEVLERVLLRRVNGALALSNVGEERD